MKNISKKEFIEYIKKSIVHGREHGIDKLVIEDENESEGRSLSITFYRNYIGEGEEINQYRKPFYELNKTDLKEIKEEMKIKAIKSKEREDFGEWVRIVEMTL